MTLRTAESEDRYQLLTYKKYPLTVESGRDVWVYMDDGERYLDLYGGHAVTITGHCHPRVVQAIQEQASKLIFYSNLVYNRARAEAAQALVEIAPSELTRAFFVNSGAEANDNALKIARQVTRRPNIVSFEGGFHGRTIGTVSVTGIPKYREKTHPLVPGHRFARFPDLDSVAELLDETVAAVLLEPIQSMAGVRMGEADFYQGLRRLCSERGAFLIYDEVQTGLGRTGDYFFAPRHGVCPDMISLAKGLASGVPVGAVLVTDEIASHLSYGDLGSTFGGGPLACAALSATIAVVRDEGLLENVRTESGYLMARCSQLPFVKETLGHGFLIGLRIEGGAAPIQKKLLQNRVLTGLSEDPEVLRLLPPLTLRRPEIDHFLNLMGSF